MICRTGNYPELVLTYSKGKSKPVLLQPKRSDEVSTCLFLIDLTIVSTSSDDE